MNHPSPALCTDLYLLTMAQAHHKASRAHLRVEFDYTFRHTPFDSGFVIFAGLHELLHTLHTLRFTNDDIEYLHSQGFEEDFLQVLRDFRFSGDIISCHEGEVVFPLEPILRVQATLLEAQLIETLVLNTLNFQSLIATKAARIARACKGLPFYEFGIRRAQGASALSASRAAYIGGAKGTSNVAAAKAYDLPAMGTMSHAWVQSFPSEREAFQTFATHYPDACTLLLDTYNTIQSGLPNAIQTAQDMALNGHTLHAVRLDSGDLAYLSKKTRSALDDAGLHHVKIIATNQLDEHLIKSLLDQHAPIDAFGVGTRLSTGHPDGALDGVYKLVAVGDEPKIKISDNFTKVNFPGPKTLHRFSDPAQGTFLADGFSQAHDAIPTTIEHPFFSEQSSDVSELSTHCLHHPYMTQGTPAPHTPSVTEIAQYAAAQLAQLPQEHKRFDNPHTYKVGVSPQLRAKRAALYTQGRS